MEVKCCGKMIWMGSAVTKKQGEVADFDSKLRHAKGKEYLRGNQVTVGNGRNGKGDANLEATPLTNGSAVTAPFFFANQSRMRFRSDDRASASGKIGYFPCRFHCPHSSFSNNCPSPLLSQHSSWKRSKTTTSTNTRSRARALRSPPAQFSLLEVNAAYFSLVSIALAYFLPLRFCAAIDKRTMDWVA